MIAMLLMVYMDSRHIFDHLYLLYFRLLRYTLFAATPIARIQVVQAPPPLFHSLICQDLPGFLNSGPFSMARDDTSDPATAHLMMVGNGGYDATSNDGPALGGHAAAAARRGGESSHAQGKTTISHSTVEKQRRDRINSLIDELRDLVPSQQGAEADAAAGNDASRRPKHAVLSDTIALVKELRTKLSVVEDQMMRMQIHDAAGTFHSGNENQAAIEGAVMAATMPPPNGGPSNPPEAAGLLKPPLPHNKTTATAAK